MRSDPLTGLRGVFALYIMIGHYSMLMEKQRYYNPGYAMPLFFLLSGYCLTLGYGKGVLNFRAYFQNRFASIMPLYWLTNLLGVYTRMPRMPAVFSGYDVRLLAATTITCTSSWFQVYDSFFPVPFQPHTWTISTLLFFYLMFPIILPRLNRLSDAMISSLLIVLYYIQLLPILYSYHYNLQDIEERRFYRFLIQSPYSRLPVFIMGMLGGVQTIRWNEDTHHKDPNENRFFIHDIIPWGFFSFGCGNAAKFDKEKSRSNWRFRTDFCCFIIIFRCVYNKIPYVSIVISQPLILKYDQLFFVYVMLNFIIGLSRAPESTFSKKILSSWIFQKLGALSLSIYLLHIHGLEVYFNFIIKKQRFPGVFEMLSCCLCIVFLAHLVHTSVETPLKKLLRFKQQEPTLPA